MYVVSCLDMNAQYCLRLWLCHCLGCGQCQCLSMSNLNLSPRRLRLNSFFDGLHLLPTHVAAAAPEPLGKKVDLVFLESGGH